LDFKVFDERAQCFDSRLFYLDLFNHGGVGFFELQRKIVFLKVGGPQVLKELNVL